MRRRSSAWVLYALCLGAAACDRTASRRDGSDGELPLARTRLALAIGEDPGAGPEYLFGRIRDVLVAPTGNVWVVDASGTPPLLTNPMVRMYDSAGVFLRKVGNEGGGPGEYREPYHLAALPDGRIALRDARVPRVTLYRASGDFDTTWSFSANLRWPHGGGYGIEADTAGVIWLPFGRSDRPGPARDEDGFRGFLRFWSDGRVADTVPFPTLPEVDERWSIRFTKVLPGGGVSMRGFTVPFAPRATWTWSPVGGFGIARTDTYQITLQVLPPPARSGARSSMTITTKSFSRDVPPIPVADGERAAAYERLLSSVRGAGGGPGDIPDLPEIKPPIKYILFADDGRLLVRVSSSASEVDGEWVEEPLMDVFEPDGTFRGRVRLPDSFLPEQMRGDQIWGVYRDAFDVESVRRYDIVWP